MNAAGQSSIVEDFLAAAGHSRELLIERLNSLNDSIRQNGQGGAVETPIAFSALSRFIYYLALAAAERSRSRSNKLRPRWSAIIGPYNKMRSATGDIFPEMDSDDRLANFCLFMSRRRGTTTARFYAGLALFAVLAEEECEFDTPFRRTLSPKGEADLAHQIRRVFDKIFAECAAEAAGAPAMPAAPTEASHAHPEIRLGFAYRPQKLAELEAYRSRFESPIEHHAHFVIYRPSRSDPDRLMKSFLAIGPARRDEAAGTERLDVFRFVHIYEPPEGVAGRAQRISLGRVVPLEDGVYLIGGQRDEHADRQPFKTLKTIALPWQALQRRDNVLNGLVMSSNYDGLHLVSRAAIRATPIPYAREIELGGVKSRDLAGDLRADAEAEQSAIAAALAAGSVLAPDWAARFPLFLPEGEKLDELLANQTRLILDLCNNSPKPDIGWEIGPGFDPVTRSRHDGMLTKNRIGLKLESEFGSEDRSKYARKAEPAVGLESETFSFWSSIRFGPLTHD